MKIRKAQVLMFACSHYNCIAVHTPGEHKGVNVKKKWKWLGARLVLAYEVGSK